MPNENQNSEQVLLLALGDDYWTPFVFDMARLLRNQGINTVIATDSRAGEYQSFGCRTEPPCRIYYFSEYLSRYGGTCIQSTNDDLTDMQSLFADYYRLYSYRSRAHLDRIDWDRLRTALQCFFIHVFDRERIGVVLHDQVSTSFSHVCYLIAKSRCIDYFGLVGARIPNRYEVRETVINEDGRFNEVFQHIVSGEAPISDDELTWVTDFMARIDEQEPSYMKGNPLNDARLRTYVNTKKLLSFFRKIKYSLVESSIDPRFEFRESPLAGSIRSLKRNLSRLQKKRAFERYESKFDKAWLDGEKFFIYPVHFQPEASTSVGSPHYVDQLGMIRNIAFILPNDTSLIVKEHKSAIGFHERSFYRDVAALPKVRLAGPQWNIKELIRHSEGVIALTSTAAFEALLLGKRVFMFGSAFFQRHPLCQRVCSWEELRVKINEPSKSVAALTTVQFLIGYQRYTRPGNIQYSEECWGIGSDLSMLITSRLRAREH